MSLGRVTREQAGSERILEAGASLEKGAELLPAALTMDEEAVPAVRRDSVGGYQLDCLWIRCGSCWGNWGIVGVIE